jgi:hypothetical protein
MKGSIQPGHMPVNKYELSFVGVPTLTALTVSGLEEELQYVEMPDRTRVSGGNTGPSELTITLPAHHTVEIAAMEAWFRESQDPVTPTYKKAGYLLIKSIALLGPTRTFNLIGVFPHKRKLPDLEMKNEGEPAVYEWTLCIDQVIPA